MILQIFIFLMKIKPADESLKITTKHASITALRVRVFHMKYTNLGSCAYEQRRNVMVFNRYQVGRVYEEMECLISIMMSQGDIENENELKEARALMRQGAYAALMATAANWEEVVHWIDEMER